MAFKFFSSHGGEELLEAIESYIKERNLKEEDYVLYFTSTSWCTTNNSVSTAHNCFMSIRV
jgi:predicted AAA+ superfamily ATPase